MPAGLSEAEYFEIEAAVMETGRGRQFLAEYARRNSPADVRMLLASVQQLQRAARVDAAPDMARICRELADLASGIDELRDELATGTMDAPHVRAAAPQDMDLSAVIERIQDIAWVLREQGFEAKVCDTLDGSVSAVQTAWKLQDASHARAATALERLGRRLQAIIGMAGQDASPRPGASANSAGPARPATLTIVEALTPIAPSSEEPFAFFT